MTYSMYVITLCFHHLHSNKKLVAKNIRNISHVSTINCTILRPAI